MDLVSGLISDAVLKISHSIETPLDESLKLPLHKTKQISYIHIHTHSSILMSRNSAYTHTVPSYTHTHTHTQFHHNVKELFPNGTINL